MQQHLEMLGCGYVQSDIVVYNMTTFAFKPSNSSTLRSNFATRCSSLTMMLTTLLFSSLFSLAAAQRAGTYVKEVHPHLLVDNYKNTSGVATVNDSVSLKLRTNLDFAYNVGSRAFLLDEEEKKYQTFVLLGNEFAFDVDLATVECGINRNVLCGDGCGWRDGAVQGE